MEYDNLVLIHKENGKFSEEGYSIKIDFGIDFVREFYEENGVINLVLSLKQDLDDEKFYNIVENFSYDDVKDMVLECYAKDEEYYPTIIFVFNNDEKVEVEEKTNNIIKIFYNNTNKNLL